MSKMAIAGFKGGRIDRRRITRQKPAYEPETAKTIKHPAGSAKARVAAEFESTRQIKRMEENWTDGGEE